MEEEVLSIKSRSKLGGNVREHVNSIWAVPFHLWRHTEWVTNLNINREKGTLRVVIEPPSNSSVTLKTPLHASMQILPALIANISSQVEMWDEAWSWMSIWWRWRWTDIKTHMQLLYITPSPNSLAPGKPSPVRWIPVLPKLPK